MSRPKLASGWCGAVDLSGASADAVARRSRVGKIANTARNEKLGAEGRRLAVVEATKARWTGLSAEERSEAARRGAIRRWEGMSVEDRRAWAMRGVAAAQALAQSLTPEERSASARKASLARWAKAKLIA